MSLFGKILAVFNIFFVLGALALMAMNYAKRQAWEYAVFRSDLMISGLPVDKNETDEQQQPIMDKIGPSTQQDIFKQASPTTPVATQQKEVERVKGELDKQIQAAGDKKKQIAALARILAPMADTIEQRLRMLAYQTHLRDDNTYAALLARLKAADAAAQERLKQAPPKPYEEAFRDALGASFNDPPGPLAEEFLAVKKANPAAQPEQVLETSLENHLTQLQGQFEQLFRPANDDKAPIVERKRAIARLLFNMVEVVSPAQPGAEAKPDLNNPAYKRFIYVVGVKAALEAANEQAGILQHLAFETNVERERERSLFAVQHRQVVDLVRDKKADIDQYNLLLAIKKKEVAAHLAKLEDRRQDVKDYEKELATARRETAANLKRLRELSNKLLQERVELRKNTEENQQLEKDIRALEEGR